MKKYNVFIHEEALNDIQNIINWYNIQLISLGIKFHKQITLQINQLKKTPLIYAVRYENVHCMRIKKFPFLVHYTINENMIQIWAVFHTSRNPEIWNNRVKL